MSAFDRLHPALQHHVVNSLGWRDLRPVQNLAIDAYLNGANLVILAPTAGGKTEAAFFPILSQMLTDSWTGLHGTLCQPDPCSSEQSAGAAGTLLSAGRQAVRLLAWRHAAI